MSQVKSRLVKEMPTHLRPRERLMKDTAQALADHELLAILLGSGTEKMNVLDISLAILSTAEGVGGLSNLTLKEVMQVHGVGKSRACIVLALAELARRMVISQHGQELNRITGAKDAARLFYSKNSNRRQECFYVMFLDVKNQIIALEELFVGTVDSSLVHPRDVFRQAVKHNACSIICAHNHPSGDVIPSREDELITLRLAEAGQLLGIMVLDHIIIGRAPESYFSFKENGKV